MTMTVLIVGGGKVGSYVASLLISEGHNAIIIEQRREELARLEADVPQAKIVWGSGTDPVDLENAGIHNANVVAAVTGSDENNLVITSLARFEFNVPRTIARVNNPKNAWLFKPDMGVDVALNQADLIGKMIVEEMSLGDMFTLLKLRQGQFSLVEEKVAPNASVVNKAIHEISLPKDCVLAAVLRKGTLIVPHGDTVLQASDEVLAIIHSSQLSQLAALLGNVTR